MSIINPNSGIIFMKVGTHAKESLSDIIARKTLEIEQTGYAMWGYGGNTCHPRTMVQPFAESLSESRSPLYLCMNAMNSQHFADPVRASEYSEDGVTWTKIPSSINVLGSRFALVLEDLKQEKLLLPLDHARVAVGNSQGRLASKYIQGHVDKACLRVDDPLESSSSEVRGNVVQIDLVAKVKSPYAVFLRNGEG